MQMEHLLAELPLSELGGSFLGVKAGSQGRVRILKTKPFSNTVEWHKQKHFRPIVRISGVQILMRPKQSAGRSREGKAVRGLEDWSVFSCLFHYGYL